MRDGQQLGPRETPWQRPSPGQASLSDMLMYRLYQAWSQSNPVFVRLCEGRYGITRREWRLLACAVEGGIMTSAELAAAAKLDLARTSRTLGTLCEKGWLRRLHDSADRRVVRVEATERGQERYLALLPEVARLNDMLVQDLSATEVEQLRGFLARIEQRRRMAEDKSYRTRPAGAPAAPAGRGRAPPFNGSPQTFATLGVCRPRSRATAVRARRAHKPAEAPLRIIHARRPEQIHLPSFRKPDRPVQGRPDITPPGRVLRFYAYYLLQVWPIFAVLLVVGLAGALVEVALFSFLADIVDLARDTPPAEFFQRHAGLLLWMAVVVMVLRPLAIAAHDLLTHQTIAPSLTTLVRWQNHRYVLGQGLAFFHNDFAGRVANRVMQAGSALRDSAVQSVDALWHVILYVVSALYLFAEADWRLVIPLVLWIVGYCCMLGYFVPRMQARAVTASEARSKLMGRIVDGYTNIGTLKLFAHARQEENYARQALAEQTEKQQLSTRVITAMDVSINTLNGVLIVGTAGLALWLWSQDSITLGAITLALGLVIRINNMSAWIMWEVSGIFENVGIVQDALSTISQPKQVLDAPAPARCASSAARCVSTTCPSTMAAPARSFRT